MLKKIWNFLVLVRTRLWILTFLYGLLCYFGVLGIWLWLIGGVLVVGAYQLCKDDL
jgi:hypothetical protein